MLIDDLNSVIHGLSMADRVLVKVVNGYHGTDNTMIDRCNSMADQIEGMISYRRMSE